MFAEGHTFNNHPEEDNRLAGRSHYKASAPTIAQMASAALKILSRDADGFVLVAEEEGTDNMANNNNNAPGTLEALRRADEAVGVLHEHVQENPGTLLLMTADSDAGGMQVVEPYPGRGVEAGKPLPEEAHNGAPLDGVDGTATPPFIAAPDKSGKRLPFAIAWTGYGAGLAAKVCLQSQ